MRLMTIGYEKASLDDFLATLEGAGISVIVDVRELPISRKRGFAKSRLSEALAQRGIGYIHLRALGDPKPGREAARRGDFARFRKLFAAHLKSEEAQAALDELREIAKTQMVCLLCYERDPQHCHRSIVAERIGRGVSNAVEHLSVAQGVADNHDQCKQAA